MTRDRRDYYEKNKEHIQQIQKAYRDTHKEQMKEYAQKHSERKNETARKRWEEHKDQHSERRKEIITCLCGCVVRKDGIKRHEQSQKHLDHCKQANQKVLHNNF